MVDGTVIVKVKVSQGCVEPALLPLGLERQLSEAEGNSQLSNQGGGSDPQNVLQSGDWCARPLEPITRKRYAVSVPRLIERWIRKLGP